jgi:hypothetical protein
MDPSRSHGPSVIATLKLTVVTVTAGLVLIFGVLLVLGFGFTGSDTLWIALPLIVGLADVVLVPAVGSTVRPLPYGASESDVRRISAGALRTVIMLRFVLAEAAALFGLVSSFLAHSLLPYAIGFTFAVPLLLMFAYPSGRVVDAVRQRLESGGVHAHLTEESTPRP